MSYDSSVIAFFINDITMMIVKKLFYCLAILFLIPHISHAQTATIAGRVVDADAHAPIELANVALLTSDSTFIAGDVTDSLGNFRIAFESSATEKEFIVQVTHLCYIKQSIMSKSATDLKIQMKTNGYNLSTVNVTAVRTKVKRRLNLEYLVTDDMRRNNQLTSEILEKIPSVFLDFNNNIYVRGNSNVLLLKDGMKMRHSSLLDLIPAGTVQKVIISYHVPSKYMKDGYTSVINIITKRNDGITLEVKPNLSYDNSWYDDKFNMNLEKGKSSFQLHYQLRYRHLKQDEETVTGNKKSKSDLTEKLEADPYRSVDNEFFGSYTYHPTSKISFGLKAYADLYRENITRLFKETRNSYNYYHERFNTQDYEAFAIYKDSTSKLQVNVNYDKEYVKDKDNYFTTANSVEQKNNSKSYTAELGYEKRFGDNLSLNAGATYCHEKDKAYFNNSGTDVADTYKNNTTSAYAEANYTVNDNLILDAGLNIHNYQRAFRNGTEVKKLNFYPAFSVSYTMRERHTLVLDYSSTINEPNLWVLLPFTRSTSPNVYKKGTPELKPEKTSTLSLEYSYSKGDCYFSAMPYFKRLENSIEYRAVSHNNGTLIDYINAENHHEYGVDFSFSGNLFKWWLVNLNFSGARQNISQNEYYRKHLYTISGQIVSLWTFAHKWSFVLQYKYNGRQLAYNGYQKPSDISLLQLTYKMNKNIKLGLLHVQPFGNMKTESQSYYENGHVKSKDVIDCRKILFTCTFNFTKGKKSEKKNIFQNKDRKY